MAPALTPTLRRLPPVHSRPAPTLPASSVLQRRHAPRQLELDLRPR